MSWKPDAERPVHLFARQAIGMAWDFRESVPPCDPDATWPARLPRSPGSGSETSKSSRRAPPIANRMASGTREASSSTRTFRWVRRRPPGRFVRFQQVAGNVIDSLEDVGLRSPEPSPALLGACRESLSGRPRSLRTRAANNLRTKSESGAALGAAPLTPPAGRGRPPPATTPTSSSPLRGPAYRARAAVSAPGTRCRRGLRSAGSPPSR